MLEESLREEDLADSIFAKQHATELKNERTGEVLHEFEKMGRRLVRQYPAQGGLTKYEEHFVGEFTRELMRPDATIYSTDRLDNQGRMLSHTTHDLSGKAMKTLQYVYDSKGKEMKYVKQHQPEERALFPFVNQQGVEEFIDPLDPATSNDTVDRVLDHIDSQELYDLFEEVNVTTFSRLRQENYTEYPPLYRAWQKGAELYGVRQKIAELESFIRGCGVQNFQIECFPRRANKASVVRMKDVAKSLEWIDKNIRMYPRAFIRNSDPKAISFMGGIGLNIAGHYDSHQEQIVINPRYATSGSEVLWHHEWYHMVDNRSGTLISEDNDWIQRFHGSSLHASGAPLYGRGTRNITDGSITYTYTPDREKGFSSGYGMINENEDQATVAEGLFDQKTAYGLASIARHDPILTEKIAYVKRQYFIRSEGRMDQQFWQDIVQGVEINAKYWETREQRGDFKKPEIEKLSSYMTYEHTLDVKQFSLKNINSKQSPEARSATIEFYLKTLTGNPYNDASVYALEVLVALERDPAKVKELQKRILPKLQEHIALLPVIDREPSQYILLASLHEAEGRTKEAMTVYREAIALFPRAYTFKKSLVQLLKKSPSNEVIAEEISTLLEAIHTESGKAVDCMALSQHYVECEKPEKALPLMQNFMSTYPFGNEAEKIRTLWESQMATAGKGEEVLALYQVLASKTPARAIDCGCYEADFLAYTLKDATRALSAYQTLYTRWPSERKARLSVEGYAKKMMDDAKDSETKQRLYTQFSELYKQATLDTKNGECAWSYTVFVAKYGTPTQAEESFRFVHQMFLEDAKKILQAGIFSENDLRNFERNLTQWNLRCPPELRPQAILYIELLQAMNEQHNCTHSLIRTIMVKAILHYENNDIPKALALCERSMLPLQNNKDYDFVHKHFLRQKWYLLCLSKPETWIAVEGNRKVAVAKKEPGVLYVQSGMRIEKLTRWESNTGDINWTNQAVLLEKKDLPRVLQATEG